MFQCLPKVFQCLTSGRAGMEGEGKQAVNGKGGSTDIAVSWRVQAAGVSQMDWKKGKETYGVQKKK